MTKTEQAIKIFRSYVENQIKSNKAGLERFASKLADDPLYAFEWGDSAVEAAADLAVAQEVMKGLDAGSPLIEISAFCAKQALHMARYPKQSSGTLPNLTTRSRMAAYAAMADNARDFADVGEKG